jgi:hypothetical protein
MKLTFIVGTGRCGSTLLHEIIAKHEEVSFFTNFEEQHGKLAFLGKWGGAFYRNNHLALTRAGKQRFAPTEAYRLIARKVSPIYVRPYRDLTGDDLTPWMKERFYNFFIQNYHKYGKPRLIHKYTGWSRIGFFSEIFPQAKFIHIVRDGRAVASSWLQMKWWGGYEGINNWLWGPLSDVQMEEWKSSDYSFATLAGISWKILMESYEKGGAALGQDRYLMIKYEDFLNAPVEQMKKILEFSELEWTDNFAKQFERFNIRKSRERAFEKDLSANQLDALEKCLSGKLSEYDYK